MSKEQDEMFKSDFKIVADYFVQVRTNKDYKPSPQIIKHVHEVLQLMAIFTNDKRFEEVQNLYIKGKESTMCEVLDKIVSQGEARGEARGKLDLLYKQIKKGRINLEEAAGDLGMTVEKLLAGFKEYNIIL